MNEAKIDLLLPYDLTPGEKVLWQGRPQWISLARRAYRTDFVAGYFAISTVWNFAQALYQTDLLAAGIAGGKTILAGVLAVSLLGLLAWLSSRSALYVVTTKRVVLKAGVALPIFFNLPYGSIVSASARFYRDGTGDIPLAIEQKDHIAYLHLWPHAKPFHLKRPEPALRCVENASEVADILSRALLAASHETSVKAEAPVTAGVVSHSETAPYAYSAAQAA